ncbi:MAG: hypothetical protein ACRDMX_11505 [Solirubrobacteraceae bacterium]
MVSGGGTSQGLLTTVSGPIAPGSYTLTASRRGRVASRRSGLVG